MQFRAACCRRGADCVYATSAAAAAEQKERASERDRASSVASVYCCHAHTVTPTLLCALPAPINKHRGAPLIVRQRRLCCRSLCLCLCLCHYRAGHI